jgi:hypothetical protein
MDIFGTIAQELQFLPYAIISAQKLMTGKTGEEKKQAVGDIVATVFNATATYDPSTVPMLQALQPAVGALIDGTVGIFKAKGLFGFGTKAA